MSPRASDTMNLLGILFGILMGGCSLVLHFANDTNKNNVDIAVLQTRYESIDRRLDNIEHALGVQGVSAARK